MGLEAELNFGLRSRSTAFFQTYFKRDYAFILLLVKE